MKNTVVTFLLVGLSLGVCAGLTIAQTRKPKTAVTSAKLSPLKTLGSVYRFKSSSFYTKYKLKKTDGWKLNTGAYNQQYMSTFAKTVIEVQAVGDKITGADIIFNERKVLSESELQLVFQLIEFLNGQSKADDKQLQLIRTNVEKVVQRITDNDVIEINRLTINAANVRGHTVLVTAAAR